MGFVRFMAGSTGRALRGAMGIALLVIGLAVGGGTGIVLAIVGVAVGAMAAADVCLLGPVAGCKLVGASKQASAGR